MIGPSCTREEKNKKKREKNVIAVTRVVAFTSRPVEVAVVIHVYMAL